MPSLESRLWLRMLRSVIGDDECWPWPGATQKGYGTLQRGTRSEGLARAHILSWELTIGTIPKGLHVLHSCDNRLCINPKHLFLGTNLDNIRDAQTKGRKGHKLTREQAAEIRSAPGKHREIAACYGVTHRVVGEIKRGKLWRFA